VYKREQILFHIRLLLVAAAVLLVPPFAIAKTPAMVYSTTCNGSRKVIPVVPPLSPIEVTVPKFVYPAGLDELYGV
jgi:hypothetical protein